MIDEIVRSPWEASGMPWGLLVDFSVMKFDQVSTVGRFAVPKDEKCNRLVLNPNVIVSPRCYLSWQMMSSLSARHFTTPSRSPADEPDAMPMEFFSRPKKFPICLVLIDVLHIMAIDPFVYLAILAMRDTLAVEIAQQPHGNLLKERATCHAPNPGSVNEGSHMLSYCP